MNIFSSIRNKIIILIIMSLGIITCNQNAKIDTDTIQKVQLSPDAPKETEAMGKLVGEWKAERSVRQQDGTWTDLKEKAMWNFYYILDGHAIQDDWIIIDSLNNKSITGTNIRIYNAEEKQWHMAWLDITVRRLASFTAINENGTVIMDGTNAKGRHVQNTFMNITDKEFDWLHQWTFDEGKTWVPIVKIHCTRINK